MVQEQTDFQARLPSDSSEILQLFRILASFRTSVDNHLDEIHGKNVWHFLVEDAEYFQNVLVPAIRYQNKQSNSAKKPKKVEKI